MACSIDRKKAIVFQEVSQLVAQLQEGFVIGGLAEVAGPQPRGVIAVLGRVGGRNHHNWQVFPFFTFPQSPQKSEPVDFRQIKIQEQKVGPRSACVLLRSPKKR
jgi:hypothetical protein